MAEAIVSNKEKLENGWREYPATMEMYDAMRDDIMEDAQALGVSETGAIKLDLGIEEMLINIIKYAYDDSGSVWIRTKKEGRFFRIDFADRGHPFNPLEENTRGAYDDDDENLEEGGLGIFLVRQNFDRVEYTYGDFRGQAANILSLWLKME